MKVFVKNMRGKPLMPCSNKKARILLKENKAKIVQYNPFTIQLTYPTGETVQPVSIGVDTGAKHVGLAVTSNQKVLYKAEIQLRGNGEESIKEVLTTRRALRRGRRNRKTRYRKPRFRNRNKSKGWLPPSVMSRVENTENWVKKFRDLLPDSELHIEVGKFDVQKMMNPEISGVEYQQGDAYGFWSTRYFVFARDNYECQICHKDKAPDGSEILHTHHRVFRSEGGTDRAENLVTVHGCCHQKFHQDLKAGKKRAIELDKELKENVRPYKEPTFMNALRKEIFRRFSNAYVTYGNITSADRHELNLTKTHFNDAIAISGIKGEITFNPNDWLHIVKTRKKSRDLHIATVSRRTKKRDKRSTPWVYHKRSKRKFYKNDRVLVEDRTTGYIHGFTGSGFYIKNESGYVKQTTKTGNQNRNIPYSKVRVLNHENGWRFYPRVDDLKPLHED